MTKQQPSGGKPPCLPEPKVPLFCQNPKPAEILAMMGRHEGLPPLNILG